MILAMMSRVALGHTGRPLQTPWWIALAFALVFCAALLRALIPILAPDWTVQSWRLSGLVWMLAFGLFLLRYTPILMQARADGKPG